MIGFNGYNGRGIAPGTTFGRVLADFVIGRLDEKSLPLPVSQPRDVAFRSVKEAVYKYGAEALHFAGARF